MPMGVVSSEEFENELSNCIKDNSIRKINESGAPVGINGSQSSITPIVHDAEVVDELDDALNDMPAKVTDKHRGRSEGDNNVPDSLRKIIGATSQIEGREEALALAKMFGVSGSSVSAYANGATSTASYHKPKKEIKDFIINRKTRMTKKALRKLNLALEGISEEKLNELSAKDLSTVAKDMSSVVRHMEPEHTGPSANGPQFVVYAPKMVQENHFETIHVTE